MRRVFDSPAKRSGRATALPHGNRLVGVRGPSASRSTASPWPKPKPKPARCSHAVHLDNIFGLFWTEAGRTAAPASRRTELHARRSARTAHPPPTHAPWRHGSTAANVCSTDAAAAEEGPCAWQRHCQHTRHYTYVPSRHSCFRYVGSAVALRVALQCRRGPFMRCAASRLAPPFRPTPTPVSVVSGALFTALRFVWRRHKAGDTCSAQYTTSRADRRP